jgi:hypothetical protein
MITRLNKHLHRTVAVLSTLLLAMLVLASSVSATPAHATARSASPPFTVTSDHGNVREISSPDAYRSLDATFYDNSKTTLQLTNVRYYVVKGLLAEDGQYHFPVRVHTGAGVQVGGIGLAVNQHNHTQLLEVGFPTAVSSAAMDQQSGIASPRMQANISPNTTTSTAPAHLIWKDPVNIWVVEVLTDLRWSWDGYTVSNCAWQDHWEHWKTATGWFAGNNPTYTGPDYNWSNGRYTWCKVTSARSFINGPFCDPNAMTYVIVYQNIAYGYPNGGRDYYYDTAASGDCANLLQPIFQWG